VYCSLCGSHVWVYRKHEKIKICQAKYEWIISPEKNDDPYVSSLKLKLTILGVVLYFLPVVGIAFLVHSLCLVQGGSVATLIDNLGGLPIITWVSLFLLLFIGVDEHFIYTLGQFLRPGNSYANSFSVGVDILWVIIAVSSCVITKTAP
jgi:fucose 4-O-acetylase-like acetyltransferase